MSADMTLMSPSIVPLTVLYGVMSNTRANAMPLKTHEAAKQDAHTMPDEPSYKGSECCP